MKKILSLCLVFLLLLGMTACQNGETTVPPESAYDHPERFVSLPPLDSLSVSACTLEQEYNELVVEILSSISQELFVPLTDTPCRAGDRVFLTYHGVCGDELPEATQKALTVTEPVSFVLGEESLPSFMEEGILGQCTGGTVTLTHTYTEEETDLAGLAGKTVQFTLNISEVGRVSVGETSLLEVEYTVTTEEEKTPKLAALLAGGRETVELADPEDTFDGVFSNASFKEAMLGASKYETRNFSLPIPEKEALALGCTPGALFHFSVRLLSAKEKPGALTDDLVASYTNGAMKTLEEFRTTSMKMLKEDLAFGAVTDAAVFGKDLPQAEYDEFYGANYNEAMAKVVGDVSSLSAAELAAILTDEVYARVEELAHENTVAELRERLLLEYLYDTLPVAMSEEEYTEQLNALFHTYQTTGQVMLIMYGITDAKGLEEFIGRDYLEVQFLYEKMLPILAERLTVTDDR